MHLWGRGFGGGRGGGGEGVEEEAPNQVLTPPTHPKSGTQVRWGGGGSKSKNSLGHTSVSENDDLTRGWISDFIHWSMLCK